MKLCERYIVKPGQCFDLAECDPSDTAGFKNKSSAKKAFNENVDRLGELQYLMYAENKRALLIVLQAMDAGGKDGTIRHVMAGMNPQGCKVTSFKVPSAREASHDYLWRIHNSVPAKGEVGIFNRSHYEDVVTVKVKGLVSIDVWSKRFDHINDFERMLTDNNVHILKFFLNVSKDEQLKRLKRRLKDPRRMWKASEADFEERKFWDDYQAAYSEAVARCNTENAPWYIVPSDKKWFRNLVVSKIICETLESLEMEFPQTAFDVSKIKVS
ncbi:MAG: polyphosphate kinase 2 family protein [Candidatus Hydrogenedentota bacterium]